MPVTTLFDPSTNADISAFDFLAYQQLPTSPVYAVPSATAASGYAIVGNLTLIPAPSFGEIPNLLDSGTQATAGTTLNTDGSVFNGLDQVDIDSLSPFVPNSAQLLAPNTFTATANTGYAGFFNYTADGLDGISFADIQSGAVDVNALLTSPTFTPISASFPVLDPIAGFTLSFDLEIANEESNANRAGFSLTLVTNNPTKEIELGFTDREGSDRIFAQSVDFTELEATTATLNFDVSSTYSLVVQNNQYVLSVDGTNVLSGDLRNYNFNPATSDPPLPASPYDFKNFLFFGDNTDQGNAEFTLGQITITTPDIGSNSGGSLPPISPYIFNFEQWVTYQAIRFGEIYQSAVVDFNVEEGGLRLAALFDETDYLSNNLDVAAAVQRDDFRYGFEHFVQFGINEGRACSDWFDADYYLAQNADVAAAVSRGEVTAIAHFLNFGHKEGRNPSAFFDDSDYLLKHPDVKAAVNAGRFDSAFEHYIEVGAEEGRLTGGLLFEEAFYLQQNADVAAAVQGGTVVSGLVHFLGSGQSEGRDPSSGFNQTAYLSRYDDVAAAVASGAFLSGFEHYLLFGRAEERITL